MAKKKSTQPATAPKTAPKKSNVKGDTGENVRVRSQEGMKKEVKPSPPPPPKKSATSSIHEKNEDS